MISDVFYILTFLMGLIIGYYMGIRRGVEVNSNTAPIQLRKESLKKGFCVICSENLNHDDNTLIERGNSNE